MLSAAYLLALVAAIDRFQLDAKRSWLDGSLFMGPHWFYGCAALFFCFIAMSTLNEALSGSERGEALAHGLCHAGLGIMSYVIWRTGMASLNPWCTGGMLCAAREEQTFPLWAAFVSGATLVLASGAFRKKPDFDELATQSHDASKFEESSSKLQNNFNVRLSTS